MTRKLKTLGVALFALLSLTAVMASAASAASFTSSTYPTTATGTSAVGNDVFTTEGGTVECATHYEGTLSAASSDWTITLTYTNCKSFGFLEASVTGCKMTFTATSTTTATVHFTGACTIISGTCHITISPQGPLSAVSLTNLGTDVSIKDNVASIKYQVVKDGFLCPFNGTGEKTGGTYKQASAITFDAVNPSTASISVS
jgi:Flp pilus assembly protein TadG